MNTAVFRPMPLLTGAVMVSPRRAAPSRLRRWVFAVLALLLGTPAFAGPVECLLSGFNFSAGYPHLISVGLETGCMIRVQWRSDENQNLGPLSGEWNLGPALGLDTTVIPFWEHAPYSYSLGIGVSFKRFTWGTYGPKGAYGLSIFYIPALYSNLQYPYSETQLQDNVPHGYYNGADIRLSAGLISYRFGYYQLSNNQFNRKGEYLGAPNFYGGSIGFGF